MSAPPMGSTSETPKSKRQRHHDVEGARGWPGRRPGRRRAPTAATKMPMLSDVLAREGDRRAGQELLQLAEGHEAAGDGQRAEQHLEARARPSARRPTSAPWPSEWNSATPTSVAASAPNACESAIRCGMAVIGTYTPSGQPMTEPSDQAGQDPRRSWTISWCTQRAHDRPPACRARRAACRGGRVSGDGQAAQPEDEQDRGGEVGGLDEQVAAGHCLAPWPASRGRAGLRSARLNILQHAVGDHEAAHHVDGGRRSPR